MFLRETGLFSFRTHPVSVAGKHHQEVMHISMHCVSREAACAAIVCLLSLCRDSDWQVLRVNLSAPQCSQTMLTVDIEGIATKTLKPVYLMQQLDEVAGLLKVHCISR